MKENMGRGDVQFRGLAAGVFHRVILAHVQLTLTPGIPLIDTGTANQDR